MPLQEKRGDFQLPALLLGFLPTAASPVLNLAPHGSASWVQSAPHGDGASVSTRVKSNDPALPRRIFWPVSNTSDNRQITQ